MISLFGEASDRLCKKLDSAATSGEVVEMESLFSRLTLDIIGKAVFNYDFDSLTNDTGVIEVRSLVISVKIALVTILCVGSAEMKASPVLSLLGSLHCSERS